MPLPASLEAELEPLVVELLLADLRAFPDLDKVAKLQPERLASARHRRGTDRRQRSRARP
jgi:hypothetical protein